jgi:ribonuclease D
VPRGRKKDKVVSLDVESTATTATTATKDHTTQKAALIQLCMGTDCRLYQNCKANEPFPKLANFLANPKITFAGVDIGDDITRLGCCNLVVSNFVDIQQRWKPAGSTNMKDSLGDYAVDLIDKEYRELKNKHCQAFHNGWEKAPLSNEHIDYASIDTYAAYKVLKRIINFERVQETLEAFKQSKVG